MCQIFDRETKCLSSEFRSAFHQENSNKFQVKGYVGACSALHNQNGHKFQNSPKSYCSCVLFAGWETTLSCKGTSVCRRVFLDFWNVFSRVNFRAGHEFLVHFSRRPKFHVRFSEIIHKKPISLLRWKKTSPSPCLCCRCFDGHHPVTFLTSTSVQIQFDCRIVYF